MANMSARMGKLLSRPRLAAVTASKSTPHSCHNGVGGVPRHLLRMVEFRAQQRNFALSSSSRVLRARAQPEELESVPASTNNASSNNKQSNRIETEIDRALYRIDFEHRKFGRLADFELDQIIRMMRDHKMCSSTQALMVLRFCGSACADNSKAVRRKRMEEVVSVLKSITTFDISHFNAILKVHLENDAKVDVTKFLGEIEAYGIQPNRVTYNHLIGIYCKEGNIVGASTVLEQMKSEGLSINITVFHSLLYGNVFNKDPASTQETLKIMENSGLVPNVETYFKMLIAAANAKDWPKVQEFLQELENRDNQLDAGDYFSLMIALNENGLKDEAASLVDKVPKRGGYFQEMRNAVPQIVFSGNAELAYSIYMNFCENRETPDHRSGVFFSRALAETDFDPERAAEMVIKLYDDGATVQLGSFLYKCLELNKIEHVEALKRAIDARPEDKRKGMFGLNLAALIARTTEHDLASASRIMKLCEGLGMFVNYHDISDMLIRQHHDPDLLPAITATKIHTDVPELPYGIVYNQMVRHLLREANPRDIKNCQMFMLNVNYTLFPGSFRKSLQTCVTKRKDIDLLIDVIALVNFRSKPQIKDIENLYQILVELASQESTQDLASSILGEVVKHKLGIPRSIYDQLRATATVDLATQKEFEEMLAEALNDFENKADIWSDEAKQQFIESRKKLVQKVIAENKLVMPTSGNYRPGRFTVPEGVKDMRKIQQNLSGRDQMDFRLQRNLIEKLIENGQNEEAMKEHLSTVEHKPDFQYMPGIGDKIVQALLDAGKVSEAEDYIQRNADRVYLDTILSVVAKFLELGEPEKANSLLANPDFKKQANGKEHKFGRLVGVCQTKEDGSTLEYIIEAVKNNFGVRSAYFMTGAVIENLLNKNDVSGAMEYFEMYVKKYRLAGGRYSLMTRLVQDENVEGLQKVIELSIRVMGEERTLYDVTGIFLKHDRRAQALKMLQTPGLTYNEKAINSMIEHFLSLGRLDCLEDLVLMSRSVFGCDREHMYRQWVTAEAKNPAKIEEIWMEMQDEGHAPGKDLKTLIAKALKSGGRPLPFSTEDLNMEEKPAAPQATKQDNKKSAKPEEGKSAKPEEETSAKTQEEKSAKPQEEKSAKTQEEKSANADEKAKSQKQGSGKVEKLNSLIDENKTSEAVDFIIKKKQYHKGPLRNLIRIMVANKEWANLKKLEEKMPRAKWNWLRLDAVVRDEKYLNDGNLFYETIKEADITNKQKAKLNSSTTKNIFSKNPELLEKFEDLASREGNLAANIVLSRLACINKDTEALVKCWSRDTREDKAKDLVFEAKSPDMLKWLCDTLNHDSSALEVAANECFKHSSDEKDTKAIVDYIQMHGVPVSVLDNNALELALTVDSFAHKDEAKRILEERKNEKETTSSSS